MAGRSCVRASCKRSMYIRCDGWIAYERRLRFLIRSLWSRRISRTAHRCFSTRTASLWWSASLRRSTTTVLKSCVIRAIPLVPMMSTYELWVWSFGQIVRTQTPEWYQNNAVLECPVTLYPLRIFITPHIDALRMPCLVFASGIPACNVSIMHSTQSWKAGPSYSWPSPGARPGVMWQIRRMASSPISPDR